MNAARGTVVDIPALTDALERGHLAGAAIDELTMLEMLAVESAKADLERAETVRNVGMSTDAATPDRIGLVFDPFGPKPSALAAKRRH